MVIFDNRDNKSNFLVEKVGLGPHYTLEKGNLTRKLIKEDKTQKKNIQGLLSCSAKMIGTIINSKKKKKTIKIYDPKTGFIPFGRKRYREVFA